MSFKPNKTKHNMKATETYNGKAQWERVHYTRTITLSSLIIQ